MSDATEPLSLDLYALTMVRGYLAADMKQTAVFEFFVRELSAARNFLIVAGVEQLLEDVERLRFPPEELDRLAERMDLDNDLLRWLGNWRFTGEVHAMTEGTACFADEPIVRVTAPLPDAQLIESRVINRVHFQTLIASKAIRCVLPAPEKPLVDYGLRRAHGLEAGLFAARSSFLAGFAGTSNVLAAQRFEIPLYGTMAHSFVQAHDTESDAFDHFARANPGNVVFILDTYDTLSAARKVVRLAPALRQAGLAIHGVRLDSGDLDGLSREVRRILDSGGLGDTRILASGNLDEYSLRRLVRQRAPIDGYGIGTSVTTSEDVPALNCAYKLQAYADRPRRKLSEGKSTWPGVRQVYRVFGRDGRMDHDVVALQHEPAHSSEPLLRHRMTGGRRLGNPPVLRDLRQQVRQATDRLPEALRSIDVVRPYPVQISDGLRKLAREIGAQTAPAAPATATRGPNRSTATKPTAAHVQCVP